MVHTVAVEVTSEQLVLLQQLALLRSQSGDVVSPGSLISGWVGSHLGSPCPECLQPRDVSRDASYTPDGGESWVSAFQSNGLLLRCSNEQCPHYLTVSVVDADTLEQRDLSVAPYTLGS